MKIGIVGAGWAGLAAAVKASEAGHEVVLWDMSAHPGGRARSGVTPPPDCPVDLDCGQHILIGAYSATLTLMQAVGVDLDRALHRRPLELLDPQGRGLRLPGGGGPAGWAFLRGLWGHSGWSVPDKVRVLIELVRWRLSGFECSDQLTVLQWCRLPPRVMRDWIDPLCIAALNTPVERASARVLMRVLGDALFAGPGGADLLLPKVPLHDLLPGPAMARLSQRGADIRLQQRVMSLEPLGQGRWSIDRTDVDALIVATPSPEAARLIEPWDGDWAQVAGSLQHEPIVTTWLHVPGCALAAPMVSLVNHEGPAQFAFDLGAIGHPWSGGLALVSSAPGRWLSGGLAELEAAAVDQARRAGLLRGMGMPSGEGLTVRSIAERRATFRCEAGLNRPRARAAVAHGGLQVAGDYVAGPYPSTLEGAVRSGLSAVDRALNS